MTGRSVVVWFVPLVGVLHSPAIALLVNQVVRVPDVVFAIAFFLSFPLQVVAFILTFVGMIVSRVVRRSMFVWIVTGIGGTALLFWLNTYGSNSWG